MSLDGLRAWIGEVERKLGMRTRVFLALTVIAIGGAGAGIYLAIDARESSVSESDVQALQEKLEARIDAGGGDAGVAGTEATQLEVEIDALRAEVEKLTGEGGGAKGDKSGGGATPSDGDGGTSGTGGASADGTGAVGAPGGGDASSARLQELLEQTKDQNAQADEGQSGK